MERLQDWRLPERLRGATFALGNFDGVHRGHAHVLRAAHGARPEVPRAVLTFEPHPREVFRPDDPPFRLQTAERARGRAGGAGRGLSWSSCPSTWRSRSCRPRRSSTDVLHGGLGAAHLACGPDFAFGHRRSGGIAFLAQRAEALGMGLTIVPPLADAQGPISSSRIRRLLQDGYPERAAKELGRPWSVSGEVQHGDKRGRLLGFPTLNVPLGRHLEPARGVYAVTVRLPGGESVPGVANVGRRPTVAEGLESRIEAHLFDWSGDLYGQEVAVAFHSFLRPERKFDGLDALTQQIAEDAEAARKALGEVPV